MKGSLKCWNDDPAISYARRGLYVAVSGNTGAGKSTLIKNVLRALTPHDKKVIGIGERALHHPLLKLMFHHPSEYAFIVQLNFLLQRYSVIYRWLSIGYSVIIERAHVDDRLFVEHYRSRGYISKEEYEAYLLLANTLHRRLPEPDIYVYLDIKPQQSIVRLREDEGAGRRPREFPGEKARREYVVSWHKLYSDHYDRMLNLQEKGLAFKRTKLLRWPATEISKNIACDLAKEIVDLANLRRGDLDAKLRRNKKT